MTHREYQLLIPTIARYACRSKGLRACGHEHEHLRQLVYGARWALWRKVAALEYLSTGVHLMSALVEGDFSTLLRLLPLAMGGAPDQVYAHIAIVRECHRILRILRIRFEYTGDHVKAWIVGNRCRHILVATTLKGAWSVLMELINGYGISKSFVSTELDAAIENHRLSFASTESVKRVEELKALRARHGV